MIRTTDRPAHRRSVNYENIAAALKYRGEEFTYDMVEQLFASGKTVPSDWSLKRLCQAVCGHEFVESLMAHYGRGGFRLLTEAPSNASQFKNITGQIFYNELHQGWMYADAGVMARLARAVQTNLESEKVAGIGKITGGAFTVRPGHPYPTAGMSEQYIETPATVKTGVIVELTREDVYFDRTGQILERAREVGEVLAIDKLERMVKVVAGIVNNHSWNGTAYDTYQTSTPWDNKDTSSGGVKLTSWADINTARAYLTAMRHPETSKPIVMSPRSLVVTPAKEFTARQIINATEVRTTSGSQEMLTVNPVGGMITDLVVSEFFKQALVDAGQSAADADDTWILGDLQKAFAYRENWPLTVVQAPAGNEAEFTRDVTARFKASERGVMAVMEPRAVVLMDQTN